MKTSILAGSVLASLALITAPLEGQSVSAQVVIRSGTASSYRQPRRVVVIEREAPRIIVVERMQRGHRGKHWRRHGYRRVVVYYVAGRYYDRYPSRRAHVQEVVVYERSGRYFRRWDDDRRHNEWKD